MQTQFGWHLVKLNDKRQAEAPALESVQDEIAQTLRQQAVQQKVEELTAAAEIERPEIEDLDPAILQNLDIVRN